ncbi:hypothetical protein [Methylobacterium oxalidis]|uniref:Uncharacterized protein n=1 Tax=Methylobacterium oxalidis TaxID=944322 RepID=A0A512JBV7_9HYPH|nr:hypothetical protein [Methylobacterium oxalidis]GEP07399.1 hypothetical protein MOX02_54370 [Methylobacterium oxalidis]GLS67655.1 hypothetical protein GCM10007888_60400 [Methylobacterium oxalidis]
MRNYTVLLIAVLLLSTSAALAQQPPDQAIERGVGDFVTTIRRGSLADAVRKIDDCWEQLAHAPRDLPRAIYCSALNFAAADFDERASSTFSTGQTISLVEARVRARRGLSAAGISPTSADGFIELIRQRSIAATSRHF